MQIENNYKIAQIGLENNYGMNIGKTVIKDAKSSKDKAIAYAAAGSDARMSGSTSPVVINSGSGNQGMTISLPIYVYCTSEGIEKEKMYRALVFANLVAIYIKSKIGSLSAFCGAVSAATAVSGAITYLKGGNKEQIENSIKNSFSNLSGVICDGAKPSCAYKIYSSLDSAFLASELALNSIVAEGGCGIIFDDIEETISAVGSVAKDGMKNTDEVILKIMISR
jgi:L-cysteine desulfidase